MQCREKCNGRFYRFERLRGKRAFASFTRARQFRGALLRAAVVGLRGGVPSGDVLARNVVTSDKSPLVEGCSSGVSFQGGIAEGYHKKSVKVAFTVSKKVSPLAVCRNKVKRRLRELYKANRMLLPSNVWIMFIALPGAASVDFKSLEADFKEICCNIASKNIISKYSATKDVGNRGDKAL